MYTYIIKECLISIPIRYKFIPVSFNVLHIVCCWHHCFRISLSTIKIPLLSYVIIYITIVINAFSAKMTF
nr:MAG TPA: hypothetical protein [Caudoviricetes sp.]